MNTLRTRRARERQEGAILLMVLLLVVMFAGLGIIAMRHTRSEMRASGAYLDATQSAAIAEAAVMLAASDIKENWDFPAQKSYYTAFQNAENQTLEVDTDTETEEDTDWFSVAFSPKDDGYCGTSGLCPASGHIPDDQLIGGNTTPYAETETLQFVEAHVTVEYKQPVLAPPAQGFSSSDDETRDYDWYYIEIRSESQFGVPAAVSAKHITRGRTRAHTRMMVGPLKSFSQ